MCCICHLHLWYLTIWTHSRALHSHNWMCLLPSVSSLIWTWKLKVRILQISMWQRCAANNTTNCKYLTICILGLNKSQLRGATIFMNGRSNKQAFRIFTWGGAQQRRQRRQRLPHESAFFKWDKNIYTFVTQGPFTVFFWSFQQHHSVFIRGVEFAQFWLGNFSCDKGWMVMDGDGWWGLPQCVLI